MYFLPCSLTSWEWQNNQLTASFLWKTILFKMKQCLILLIGYKTETLFKVVGTLRNRTSFRVHQ